MEKNRNSFKQTGENTVERDLSGEKQEEILDNPSLSEQEKIQQLKDIFQNYWASVPNLNVLLKKYGYLLNIKTIGMLALLTAYTVVWSSKKTPENRIKTEISTKSPEKILQKTATIDKEELKKALNKEENTTKKSHSTLTKNSSEEVIETLKDTTKIEEERPQIRANENELIKETIGKYTILKDPNAPVYYRKVQKGEKQTLYSVHQALKKDKRFKHLQHSSYKPQKNGNIKGRNIPAQFLQIGDLVPVPLDRMRTQIAQKDMEKSLETGIQKSKQNKTRGDFVSRIESKLGDNYLKKLMIATGQKESHHGVTGMYRYEKRYKAYSYGVFHVLDYGPGKQALNELGYSTAEVMTDPAKSSEWFRGYWYYKFEALKHNDNFQKNYYNTPENLFKKIKSVGRLYNGTRSYGIDLKKIFDDIELEK